MAVSVTRLSGPVVVPGQDYTTFQQQFAFSGVGAERLSKLMWKKPMVGDVSLLGPKPFRSTVDDRSYRRINGFEPAPGFKFDVEVRRQLGSTTGFVVQFSQPSRKVPYLQGGLLWRFMEGPPENGQETTVLDEQINTTLALQHVEEPLHGPRPSLRRWAFFRVGHAQIMMSMALNLAAFASAPPPS